MVWADLADEVVPGRAMELIESLTDERIEWLIGADLEVERARVIRDGAGVDSPADMTPPAAPKRRGRKTKDASEGRRLGDPVPVDPPTMGHVIGALSAAWVDIEQIATMSGTAYEVAGRALAIAKANGKAFARTNPETLAIEYRDASPGAEL
jgi:hypothetical protein